MKRENVVCSCSFSICIFFESVIFYFCFVLFSEILSEFCELYQTLIRDYHGQEQYAKHSTLMFFSSDGL